MEHKKSKKKKKKKKEKEKKGTSVVCQEVVKRNPFLANIFLIRTKYPK